MDSCPLAHLPEVDLSRNEVDVSFAVFRTMEDHSFIDWIEELRAEGCSLVVSALENLLERLFRIAAQPTEGFLLVAPGPRGRGSLLVPQRDRMYAVSENRLRLVHVRTP